jgi:hypothetical protein
LDCDYHRRTRFEEPDIGIGSLWRLIGIEPEVIQRAKANGVSGLVLCECFTVPSNGTIASLVIIAPRRSAVSVATWDVIIGPTGFLGRRMKPNVTNVDAKS